MRIYVADKGDTLVKIGNRYQVGLDQLLSFNPHILSPDAIIEGARQHPYPIDAKGGSQGSSPLLPAGAAI